MYLRTPKKYTRSAQKPRVFNGRRVIFRAVTWLVMGGLILLGVEVYRNQDSFGPPVQAWINERVNEAQRNVATAVAPTPLPTEDPTIRRGQADEAWRRGSIEEAMNIYEAILPALPNDVLVHYQVTLGMIIEGRYADALTAAENTITANPYSSDAWGIQAFAQLQNGRNGEAIASATQALGLDENNVNAMSYLAEAYFNIGRYDDAFATVERGMAIDANNFNLYRVQGILEQNVNFDFEAARNDYQTAYDLAPNLIYPIFDLVGFEAFAFSEYEDSITTLREIIDLNPRNGRALYWVGWLYRRHVGDPEQAVSFLARCVEANPNNADCNYELGRLEGDRFDYERASELFQQAVESGTTNPYHYYWAGYSQILVGNCPGGIPYLMDGYPLAEAFVDRDPSLIELYTEALTDCQAPGFNFVPTEEATPEVTPDEGS
jgi:tetratricopeptide (TPR) repeat protein